MNPHSRQECTKSQLLKPPGKSFPCFPLFLICLWGNCRSTSHQSQYRIMMEVMPYCVRAQSCLTLRDPMDCSPPGSSVHGDFPDKNTGVGCHVLLEIFPTQGSNPGLVHSRQILYPLSHQGSPGILEWVAYPFSRDLLTQESNRGLLHGRQIIYQLNYQGSPV